MADATVTVNIADAATVKQSIEQATETIKDLRSLVLDMEGWILSVAPHSYLEGSKAQSIRERVKALIGLPKEDVEGD